MDLKSKIEKLNEMVLNGQAMDALEEFYAENVVMQENNEEPILGKEANRKREEEFFSKITDFRGAAVKSVAVGENVTMVEWHFDYTHVDRGDCKYDQVAVQRWENGLIVNERFYYGS